MAVHGSAFEAFGFQTDWRLLAEWWWFRIGVFAVWGVLVPESCLSGFFIE